MPYTRADAFLSLCTRIHLHISTGFVATYGIFRSKLFFSKHRFTFLLFLPFAYQRLQERPSRGIELQNVIWDTKSRQGLSKLSRANNRHHIDDGGCCAANFSGSKIAIAVQRKIIAWQPVQPKRALPLHHGRRKASHSPPLCKHAPK